MRLAKSNPNGIPVDIDEAAAYWLARRSLGSMTARDEAAFSSWRADAAHAAAYEAASAAMDAAGAVAADEQMRLMRDAALACRHTKTSAQLSSRYSAAAGILLAALFAAYAWIDRPASEVVVPSHSTIAHDNAVPALAQPQRYATKVGERSNVTLEDGSIVSLNTASLIEVAYSPERREVRLVRGQALFQVAKNADRPFVVAAGDRRVKALGTAFDVRIDAGSVKVVLLEGRVTVEPMKRSGVERLLPVLARQELAPGEQLISDENHAVTVAVADIDRDTSWRRGEVIFRDDTLAAAVAEMNRYAQGQIIVDDPRIAGLRVSGVFAVSRPENFIAAITAYYPIDAQRRSPGVTILAWRENDPRGAPPQMPTR